MALVAGLVLLTLSAAPASAAPYPPVPIGEDRSFLANLSAPPLAPGGSGTILFTVTDPSSFSPRLLSVVVELGVYAFNGYPGNGSSLLPVANTPVLVNSTGSGRNVTVLLGTVVPGATAHGSVGVETSGDTPAGTYAVRTAVSFTVPNGTSYRLESRGWFSDSLWRNATVAPNGSAYLNNTSLALLQVSGVVPETAVLVTPTGWPLALGLVAAAGFVLVGAAAWLYFRRPPASRSGAR